MALSPALRDLDGVDTITQLTGVRTRFMTMVDVNYILYFHLGVSRQHWHPAVVPHDASFTKDLLCIPMSPALIPDAGNTER